MGCAGADETDAIQLALGHTARGTGLAEGALGSPPLPSRPEPREPNVRHPKSGGMDGGMGSRARHTAGVGGAPCPWHPTPIPYTAYPEGWRRCELESARLTIALRRGAFCWLQIWRGATARVCQDEMVRGQALAFLWHVTFSRQKA